MCLNNVAKILEFGEEKTEFTFVCVQKTAAPGLQRESVSTEGLAQHRESSSYSLQFSFFSSLSDAQRENIEERVQTCSLETEK